jgi:SAM-dependent methyltransferase
VYDWLDALVTLRFLERDGLYESASYHNAFDTNAFLDKNKPSYIGGILEMANNRLYQFWGDLETGLLSGEPQNETKGKLMDVGFDELYKSAEKLQEFMDAMSGIQTGNFMALAHKFDFSRYETLVDIGGADAWLSIQLCLQYPNLQCTSFDLPQVEQVAKAKLEKFNLGKRIKIVSGNFNHAPFPTGDIITMGNILHGENEEGKQRLVQKVYDALNPGGVFLAIENIIDNERKQNLFGMLMSLNMLIENGDGFDYTGDDFNRWATNAGFTRTEVIPLTGPASAAVAYK